MRPGEPAQQVASSRPSLLEVVDLDLAFQTPRGRVLALRDVSLAVQPGEIVGVVGESGSGKSTLAYTVMGLLAENAEVTGGAIPFEGRDLLSMTAEKRRRLLGNRMSMIFQDPTTALNPVRSIEKQMIDIQHHQGGSRREKRRRAIEMLERVGIPDPQSRIGGYAHEFSGGMRQRICIAMALLVKPALLIADEPTTALDATLEVQIIHLLKDLQREIGCSIIFVSHHLGTVAELCDRVAVMYAGEMVEYGTVRQIFHHPGHPYTKALLECDPGRIRTKTRVLPTIPGEVPNLVEPPSGCIFRERCPHSFDRCVTEVPAPRDLAPTQWARCHLLDDAAEAPA
ncbi:ABC transporter ATP-binding protein [Chelativorans sp. M5D2P16]|uniref:ABC transporter ATP-binding protein n=1 Tax=Chelativorans sp. M5D2P16 TaxID=3095678 RepID=UPI002ACA1F1F|nr:ABC transporter ATP-binding protein [Chelativorans sp. M5D2P16]MDZ5698632.1 ABC transporter ATP-binding protein [Chelativorans sp. M5D2P16]